MPVALKLKRLREQELNMSKQTMFNMIDERVQYTLDQVEAQSEE